MILLMICYLYIGLLCFSLTLNTMILISPRENKRLVKTTEQINGSELGQEFIFSKYSTKDSAITLHTLK